MTVKNLAVVTLNLLVWLVFCGSVTAGTLSGKIRVDDRFSAYLSTDDNVQGTLLVSGNQWNGVFALNADLVDGQNYYLHVYGKDNGGIAGLLAELNLSGNHHVFSNNSSHILSNTSNWKVSTSGWGNYVAASDSNGNNGSSSAQIAAEATWIWAANPASHSETYFTIAISSQASSYAGELSGKIRVDDRFSAYLSTDDNVQGTLLGSGTDWQTTFSLNTSLSEGQNYYLHIYGKDLQDIAGFLGEFSLTGNDHVFANNQNSILTNTADWKVSKTGWGNYVNASMVNGNNGVSPWGNNPQIASNATWIWSADAQNDNDVYFSLAILSKAAAEPEGSCEAVFPNGVSSHAANSHIDFGYNAQILGASSNVLATSTVTANGGSNKKTCQSQNCSASGTSAEAMTVGEFVSKNSNTDVIINYQGSATVGSGSNPGNSYRDINAYYASQATITFSNNHNEYFINRLILADVNTLYLQAGSTYWINQLITSSQAKIVVQGSGTAIVYVNQSIAFPSPGYINSPSANSTGDASKLVMYAYNDVSFNNQTTFSGSLYAKGNITLGSASYAFGAISASNITMGSDSTITYQASTIANTVYGNMCASATTGVDHFRIEHDGQGFTCEAETVLVKACANASCDTLYDKETSITLAPGTLAGGNAFSFTGSVVKSLSISTPDTYTLTKTASSESADLRCFSGATETCDIAFVDAGFEFIGATINDKTLPDQIAETNFTNAQLRAIKKDTNTGVCQAALTGSKNITFGYNCDSPASCNKPLAGIAVSNATGENSGTLNLTFDNNGIASLSGLNYADAGRLSLSAKAIINNGTILAGTASVDVYPDYLQIDVPATMTSADPAAIATAGKIFEWQVSAYGKAGHLLPNYQPGDIKLRVLRSLPTATGSADGQFQFRPGGMVNSSTNDTLYTAVSLPTFSNGSYSYNAAYYSETGRISLDVQDADYLGNKICTVSGSAGVCDPAEITGLTLTRFIPAYYLVEAEEQPALQDVNVNPSPVDSFTYVGQTNQFAVNPKLRVTAKNALNQTTLNYDSGLASAAGTAQGEWLLEPGLDDLNDQVSFMDSSVFTAIGLAKVNKGSGVVLGDIGDFDGAVVIEIQNAAITYPKTDVNNVRYLPVNPFEASVDIVFNALFLTDSNGLCFRNQYSDATCSDFSFSQATETAVHGANLRFGRFAFKSTYGPEDLPLTPGFVSEYFINDKWLVNTLDNETTINFSQTATQLLLLKKGDVNDQDLTGLISPVSSNGSLLLGVPDDSLDFKLTAPGQMGEVYLRLNPTADPSGWSEYLNYDWNDDGYICNQVSGCLGSKGIDFPQATISFGLFRGNDRVIQWREVFN